MQFDLYPIHHSISNCQSPVRHSAQQYLHRDRLQIVSVGDPDVVRAPLEALGVGSVKVYDAEGTPAI